MIYVNDLKSNDLAKCEYKLLAQIVCDSKANNFVEKELQYDSKPKEGVSPVWIATYHVLNKTPMGEIKNLIDKSSKDRVFSNREYIYLYISTYLKQAYKQKGLKIKGIESNLANLVFSQEMFNELDVEINSLLLTAKNRRNKGVIHLYTNVSYVRAAIRQSFRKQQPEMLRMSETNILTKLENDFQRDVVNEVNYNLSDNVMEEWEVEKAIVYAFSTWYIKKWVRDNSQQSFKRGNIIGMDGEETVYLENLKNIEIDTVSEDIDFKKIVLDINQTSHDFFSVSGRTSYNIVDWRKDKVIKNIVNALNHEVHNFNIPTARNRVGVVNVDNLINTDNKNIIKYFRYKPRGFDFDNLTIRRFENRIMLLEYIYMNYMDITPSTIRYHYNRFFTLNISVSGKDGDWPHIKVVEKDTPDGLDKFSKVVSSVVSLIQLENQLAKWGMNILNIPSKVFTDVGLLERFESLKMYINFNNKEVVDKDIYKLLTDGIEVEDVKYDMDNNAVYNLLFDHSYNKNKDGMVRDPEVLAKMKRYRMLTIPELEVFKQVVEKESVLKKESIDLKQIVSVLDKSQSAGVVRNSMLNIVLGLFKGTLSENTTEWDFNEKEMELLVKSLVNLNSNSDLIYEIVGFISYFAMEKEGAPYRGILAKNGLDLNYYVNIQKVMSSKFKTGTVQFYQSVGRRMILNMIGSKDNYIFTVNNNPKLNLYEGTKDDMHLEKAKAVVSKGVFKRVEVLQLVRVILMIVNQIGLAWAEGNEMYFDEVNEYYTVDKFNYSFNISIFIRQAYVREYLRKSLSKVSEAYSKVNIDNDLDFIDEFVDTKDIYEFVDRIDKFKYIKGSEINMANRMSLRLKGFVDGLEIGGLCEINSLSDNKDYTTTMYKIVYLMLDTFVGEDVKGMLTSVEEYYNYVVGNISKKFRLNDIKQNTIQPYEYYQNYIISLTEVSEKIKRQEYKSISVGVMRDEIESRYLLDKEVDGLGYVKRKGGDYVFRDSGRSISFLHISGNVVTFSKTIEDVKETITHYKKEQSNYWIR